MKSSLNLWFDVGAVEIDLCLKSTLFLRRQTDVNLMTDYYL